MSHTSTRTYEETIGGDGQLYRGEDKTLQWRILSSVDGAQVNVAGWAVLFVVRLRDNSTDLVISKSATVVGTYSADPTLNTQYLQVVLTDDPDMSIDAPKKYRYSLKRMDDTHEDILRAGDFVVELATQW